MSLFSVYLAYFIILPPWHRDGRIGLVLFRIKKFVFLYAQHLRKPQDMRLRTVAELLSVRIDVGDRDIAHSGKLCKLLNGQMSFLPEFANPVWLLILMDKQIFRLHFQIIGNPVYIAQRHAFQQALSAQKVLRCGS